ncbi:acyl-CoA dehydrogenase C-terminal domain-containing protein [Aliikangiella sp. IMCC44359]|uniref:acyl-CoA dehydrogenase C-terminal domain-containing protein n=1 Tax=Aliikangiella sp. IMCC44359 TaxID=3459125 RepID=UPI00403AB2BB
MPQYSAPINEFQFILHDWLNITQHYQEIGAEDAADRSLINAILTESARFTEEVISPLNYKGDQQGCTISDGQVGTPNGFTEAYQQYCESGWASLACSTEYGGQGLPYSLSSALSEMVSSANSAWGMYPGLTHGAISALEHHAGESLKKAFLPKLISGEWTGTMCLTEAHCGSDLGLIKTSAVADKNGDYLISGSKIFISAGEHDMSDNIIHLVLARLKGSPAGTAGISLFLVPKMLKPCPEQLTDNQVTCSSIEHKMGIKASATCVINFDQSKGYLIGEINKGLSCMFTMMNKARLATGIQGYAIAELSRQASLQYAKERVQMRALSGAHSPDLPADPIIVHPDVKRMLFIQKALVEGCRGLAFYAATLVDKVESNNDPDLKYEKRLSLLTPICKAFMSEAGFESCNLGLQVFGGHGYITESEMEQQVRDSRIASIYEGTNGIQAIDLLARKVLRDNQQTLKLWIEDIQQTTSLAPANLAIYANDLSELCDEWLNLTKTVEEKVQEDANEIGAAAYDFLMYSGYISVAYILLQQASCVEQSQQTDTFKRSKKQTLRFYFERLLPRTQTHKSLIMSGVGALQCDEFELD